MLTKRIIACLDVRGGRVVKGVQFVDIVDAGDPAELAHRHAAAGADEIVLLDITATHEGRGTLIDTVKRTAAQLFVPFTVGGGIRIGRGCSGGIRRGRGQGEHQLGSDRAAGADRRDRRKLRGAGGHRGDRCTARPAAAWKTPKSMSAADARPTGLRVVEWAREAEERGAGEILLTSMDTDGMRAASTAS